jgi:hypothetical protein
MLIYKQLGAAAQEEFANSWGIGFALNNASEWQEVAKTAAQTAIVLVVLDVLRITRNADWFAEHGALSHAGVRYVCCGGVSRASRHA